MIRAVADGITSTVTCITSTTGKNFATRDFRSSAKFSLHCFSRSDSGGAVCTLRLITRSLQVTFMPFHSLVALHRSSPTDLGDCERQAKMSNFSSRLFFVARSESRHAGCSLKLLLISCILCLKERFLTSLYGPTLGARAGTGGTSPPGTRTMMILISSAAPGLAIMKLHETQCE